MATKADKLCFPASEVRRLAIDILRGNGMPSEGAEVVARCLVAADLRGVDTHGCNRLPSYMERIRQGVLDPKATPTLDQVTPVVAQVDGHNGFGFLAASLGMDKAIEMAGTYGIGMVSIKHSNHFGMSAWIVQRAIDSNMMSLVFTNSSPALPAFGGRSKVLGVSPLACGAPAGTTRPFILDMAPSIAARGKIYKAKRRGEKIPLDWALDADGNPTDDPSKALEGVMLPMGGPKGSALAIMMDVFSGVLSGSAFAGHVTNPYDPSKPADVGHFLVAIKPDLFLSLDEFKARMDYLYQRVVGSQKRPDVDRIYFPGEMEQITQDRREREGIPYAEAEVTALNEEARKSIIERIFPHSPRPRSRLQSSLYDDAGAASASRPIALRDYEDRGLPATKPTLPAPTLHHEDAFLPVERAAKALQRNIQAFLDAQSERLATHAGGEDDVCPNRSTATATATASRRPAGLKTIPIRQPRQKKISLRGSRRGLARAMDELVQLKELELRIIDRESRGRERALQQTQAFAGKKASLEAEILAMNSEDNKTAAPQSLRAEADRVDAEIRELEKRVMELRTRHAHLIDQAQQVENALDSKLSSYTSSLALVEKDIRQFLRTPPVPSSLACADDASTSAGGGGMYALQPDRRTLDMAQEQWVREQSQLAQRNAEVEDERGALEEGARLWRDTVQKIGDYEDELDALVAHVSSALATAEGRGWNLLICCLGAELEALQQAQGADDDADPGPVADLLNGTTSDTGTGVAAASRRFKASSSNESLQDTLRAFDVGTVSK
ncbi:hypothetical protein DV737_g5040, partial [Chaetothyriales sp. CBS 132003]